jgi:hypothetical protein
LAPVLARSQVVNARQQSEQVLALQVHISIHGTNVIDVTKK